MQNTDIVAIILIVFAVGLFIADQQGWIPSEVPGKLATILSIVIAVIGIIAFIYSPNPLGGDPRISILNSLEQPIMIKIDLESRGIVNAGDTKTFLVDSFPAFVEWESVKVQTAGGNFMGVLMGGKMDRVNDNATIEIDHVIKDQKYFFPEVTNNTDGNCIFSFSLTLPQTNEPGIFIPPHTTSPLGYYELEDDSNIYFHCEGSDLPYLIKWGANPSPVALEGELEGEVESPSGILRLTIND